MNGYVTDAIRIARRTYPTAMRRIKRERTTPSNPTRSSARTEASRRRGGTRTVAIRAIHRIIAPTRPSIAACSTIRLSVPMAEAIGPDDSVPTNRPAMAAPVHNGKRRLA